MITADARKERREALLEAGARHVLTKPIDLGRLVDLAIAARDGRL
jgi:CheY-like chemotaxis protein